MKMIDKGSTKHLILLIIITAIIAMIIYPLLDYFYYKLIVNREFVYTVHNYIVEPIVFACIFGTTCWILSKDSRK